MKKTITISILLGCSLIALAGYYAINGKTVDETTQTVQTTAETVDSVHYEIPKMENGNAEQIITHVGYTVSYNGEWLIPNWVAYELTAGETDGKEKRNSKFSPDPMVKGVAVLHEDYKKSGYDRGHMAPAADMKWSEQAMDESFYTTNICPQNGNNNRGDWKDLEELARDWAMKYGNIYICCGPIVSAGYSTIGTKNIVVPQEFFKVFLRRDGDNWHAIGFVMQNKAQSRPLMTYALSIDEVETKTGIDFFYNLPDSIESRVEADFDFADWTAK